MVGKGRIEGSADRILAALSLALVAVHFLRQGHWSLVVTALVTALAVAVARVGWVRWVAVIALSAAAGLWLHTAARLVAGRLEQGGSWVRLAMILGAVAAAASLAAWRLARHPGTFDRQLPRARLQAAVWLAVALALGAVQQWAPDRLLLLERYAPGWGWLEVLAIATYAAWLSARLWDPRTSAQVRVGLWSAFSVVFFTQLVLGLAGLARMLMTGHLHLPVPTLILAGPVYRGDGLFMVILFVVTSLLVGPAWCSHLCYVGAWDGVASRQGPRPGPLPAWAGRARVLLLVGVLLTATTLRLLGVGALIAASLAALFGLAGLGLMICWSRRCGTMVHCTLWCPAGLAADLLGRLSPWRIAVNSGCTLCQRCLGACRYHALSVAHLKRGRPGLSCSLCGDCVSACPHAAITYRFPGLAPQTARTAFVGLVTVLHAVFVAVARM
jgi:ferredoxin